MNPSDGNILVIDDNADVLFSVKLLLKNHFKNVTTCTDPKKLHSIIQNDDYDVVLLDMNYAGSDTSGREGMYWLERIMELDHPPQVVMLTAYGTVDLAVQALKKGAIDFVLKPWQNEKLLATAYAAFELSRSKKEIKTLKASNKQLNDEIGKNFNELIGHSPQMIALHDIINKIADTDANVIIFGENGTGKELVARCIHQQSKRAKKAMVTVDLGSISETLFESELFGHVKGAFTDAKDDRIGRFELANDSTLFLDEVGNIPLNLQAKLLSALQNRQITRVGSHKQIPVDIRLICATNAPLYEKVLDGNFREDLLYRIKTIEVHLPALRERDGDIELLSNHFLNKYCKKYKKQDMKIGVEALKKLEQYTWPGNVRELQHAIERAVILCDHRVLKPEDFLLKAPVKKTVDSNNLNLENIEATTIKKSLESNDYNISRAAKQLGLSRAALYRKMEKYDIK